VNRLGGISHRLSLGLGGTASGASVATSRMSALYKTVEK
jgi:hypothetical protein